MESINDSKGQRKCIQPGISNDIRTLAETCTVCQENSMSQPKETQLQTEVPLHAWERLGMDLFKLNEEHFLLVIDYYSRFLILRKQNSLRTATTVLHLKQIFLGIWHPKDCSNRWGITIQHRASRLCKLWCFQHINSSPHHHQSNGLADIFVQTVKATLIKTMATQEDPHLALLVH